MSEDTSAPPAEKPKSKSHRIGLFGPSIAVVVAALGWTGFWFYTAHTVETALHAQQAGLIKQGYQVSVDPWHVGGFPYRMHVDLRNLTIVAPSGRGFMAPVLEAEANAYALDKWVMAAPQGLTIYRGRTHPGVAGGADLGKLSVTGKSLKASLSGLRNPVQNVAFQGTDLHVVASDPTHPFTFETAELFEAYVRPDAADKDSADWLVRLEGARGLPGGFVGNFSPQKPLDTHMEGTISKISAFRKVDFATGLKAWKSGGVVSGFKCELKNGDLSVMASSNALGFDATSHLTGHMDIDMSGTFKPLDVLAAAGLISQDNMTLAKPLLDMTLATAGPQKMGIDFHDGSAYIGPLKLSDAPILP